MTTDKAPEPPSAESATEPASRRARHAGARRPSCRRWAAIIEVHEIGKSYGSVIALRDVTTTVKRGRGHLRAR